MMERVEFAEEREKKAKATKDQLIEIIRTFECDDRSKFAADLTALKDFYEQMLQDLKAELEQDADRYKEQIIDLETQIQRNNHKESTQHVYIDQSERTLVLELREKIAHLEHENYQYKIKTDQGQDVSEASYEEGARVRENICSLKEEHKQIMKSMQNEYSENVMKIISNYENKLLDLRMKTNRKSQSECLRCVAREQTINSVCESPGKVSEVYEEYRPEAQDNEYVRQYRATIEGNQQRNSLPKHNRKMCESISFPGLRANNAHSSIKRENFPSKSTANDNMFLNVPKVNNFSLAISGQSREQEGEQYENSVEYNPLPFTQEALYENSKNKYILDSINKTPKRDHPNMQPARETMGKSIVKYVDSDNKDNEPGNDRVLRDIRNVDCFDNRISRNDGSTISNHIHKHENRQEYGSKHSEFLRKVKEITPRDRELSKRSAFTRSGYEPEDEQGYLHRQIIDLLNKAEHSRVSARSKHLETSQRHIPVPQIDLNESRWGANDRGFLNFYRENWHSSAFTLEDD